MKILYILFFLIGGFLLNMGVYSVSEDYRNFLYTLKYDEKENFVVSDEYTIESESNASLEASLSSGDTTEEETRIPIDNITKPETITATESLPTIEVDTTRIKTVIMSENDQKIFSLFSQFNMLEQHSHSSLFDVTTEYPDKYIEYANGEMNLYFFPSKTYSQVKDILYVESDGAIFTIKETNNFGERSLYINLGLVYDDNKVRIVISYKGSTFGLKISKNQYNTVKELLEQL